VRLAGAAAAAVAVTVLAGCDPCFGTVECSTAPLLSVNGQIVRTEDGHGVRNVHIDFIRTGGASLAADSLSTTTDADGFWRIAVAASSTSEVKADFVVTTAAARYRVPSVTLRPSTRAGESNVLNRWVDRPYFPFLGQLHWPGDVEDGAAFSHVEFTRTSGVPFVGPAGGTASGETDGHGFVALFGARSPVFARDAGDVFGDLAVTSAGHRTVTRNVRLIARYEYHRPTEIIVIAVGPSSRWVVVTKNRVTLAPQPGVQVRFTRRGGADVTPETGVAVSDSTGYALLPVRALDSGTVAFDLEITPPAPGAQFTLRDVMMSTYQDQFPRVSAIVDVMPHLPYIGIVKVAGGPAAGVTVEFRRTSGIRIKETLITGAAAGGTFALHPSPLEAGDLFGDLTIRARAPLRSFIVRNLKLSTVDGLGPHEDRLLWVWDLDFAQPTAPPGTTIEFIPSTTAAPFGSRTPPDRPAGAR
jgi:hypothetical protein